MEGKNKSKPRAILVFGAPKSGKTTFCEKFSAQFRAPFFNLAELQEQSKLTRKHILIIIEQLAKTGQTLIFEGGINTEKERREMRNILVRAGYQPALVWIQTDQNTLKSRMREDYRTAAEAKSAFDEKVKKIEAPAEAESPIVLSGKHTYATQLKHVLTNLAK